MILYLGKLMLVSKKSSILSLSINDHYHFNQNRHYFRPKTSLFSTKDVITLRQKRHNFPPKTSLFSIKKCRRYIWRSTLLFYRVEESWLRDGFTFLQILYHKNFYVFEWSTVLSTEFYPPPSGLVVMGGDSCSRGCEFKSQHWIPTCRRLIFHIYLLYNRWWYGWLNLTKINEKEAWDGPFKTNI